MLDDDRTPAAARGDADLVRLPADLEGGNIRVVDEYLILLLLSLFKLNMK